MGSRRKSRREILQELQGQSQQEGQQAQLVQVDTTKVSKVLSQLLPEYRRLEELFKGLEELERALRT
jgi:hypothetical protein